MKENAAYDESITQVVTEAGLQMLTWFINSCHDNASEEIIELYLNIFSKLVCSSLLLGYDSSGIQQINQIVVALLDLSCIVMDENEQNDIVFVKIFVQILTIVDYKLEREVRNAITKGLMKILVNSSRTAVKEFSFDGLLRCVTFYVDYSGKCLEEHLRICFENIELIANMKNNMNLTPGEIAECDSVNHNRRCRKSSNSLENPSTASENLLNYFSVKLLSSALGQDQIERDLLSFYKAKLCIITNLIFSSDSKTLQSVLELIMLMYRKGKDTLKRELDILLSTAVLFCNSNDCPLASKRILLKFFISILEQPEVCIEIYMNYDCDAESSIDILNNILMSFCDVNIQDNALIELDIAGIQAFIRTVYEWNFMSDHNKKNTKSISPVCRSQQFAEFGKMRDHKTMLDVGFSIFTKDCYKGIDYFVKEGIVESNDFSIGQFMFEHIHHLSRDQLGEYFSSPNHISIFKIFLQQILSSEVDLLEALRKILDYFQLPGESQKIDRLMNSFAEVFCQSNLDSKWNSDSAYIVSYALIMLNTDLHNKNVIYKITKEQFLANSKFIVDKYNVEKEELENFYDRISKSAITFNEYDSHIKPLKSSSFSLQPKQFFTFSSAEKLLERAEKMIHSEAKSLVSPFYHAMHEESFHELLLASFQSLLNSIKIMLQLTNNFEQFQILFNSIYTLCLITLKLSIQEEFESAFQMNCSILFDFIKLHVNRDPCTDIKLMLCIKNTLTIAQMAKNHMIALWPYFFDFLACCNQLHFFEKTNYVESCPIYNYLDKFVSNSSALDEKNIFLFMQFLCNASMKEILTNGGTFFLERLLEAAHYNTARVRFEWHKVWSTIGAFFVSVMKDCDQIRVLRFIVDSLKQLTCKYLLQMGESKESTIQKDFLFTFCELLVCTRNIEIVDLILSCLFQIVLQNGSLIKTGWHSVLKCIEISFSMMTDSSVILHYQIWKVFAEHFEGSIPEQTTVLFKEIFVKLLKTNEHSKQRIDCIEIFRSILDKAYTENGELNNNFSVLLSGIREGCDCTDLEVRSLCLNCLFSYFNYELKSANNYNYLFMQYFYSLFDLISNDSTVAERTEKENEEFRSTTLISAFKYFCLLITSPSYQKNDLIFDLFMKLIESSLFNSDVNIVRVAFFCLQEMLRERLDILQESDQWQEFIFNVIYKLSSSNINTILLSEFLSESNENLFHLLSIEKLFKIAEKLPADEFVRVKWYMAKQFIAADKYEDFFDAVLTDSFSMDRLHFIIPQILADFISEGLYKNAERCSTLDKQVFKFMRCCKVDWNEYKEELANYLESRISKCYKE